MADIARHVGVSGPLVSIVVRLRVFEAVAELGHRPDSGPRSAQPAHPTPRRGLRFRRPFEVEPPGEVWARRDLAR